MTSVYLAAAYSSRDALRESYLPALAAAGIDCTSTWLTETHQMTEGSLGAATAMTDQYAFDHVMMDLEDVKRSDVLVVITNGWLAGEGIPAVSGGGRHVEMGTAMALSIPIIVLGEPENIFQRICATEETWEALLLTLLNLF